MAVSQIDAAGKNLQKIMIARPAIRSDSNRLSSAGIESNVTRPRRFLERGVGNRLDISGLLDIRIKERFMRSVLIGAVAVAFAAFVTPASAQHVISNPGWCAQFYPNANCQNYGPGNPYTGDYQARRGWYGSNALMQPRHWRPHRHYKHRRAR